MFAFHLWCDTSRPHPEPFLWGSFNSQALDRDRELLQYEWELFKADRVRFDAEVSAARRGRRIVIHGPAAVSGASAVAGGDAGGTRESADLGLD